MSGHSKWSTIKRQKGVADIKRGLTFTKIASAIAIAARLGGSGDPESNPRLRAALESARTVNMPKDNIQRAIDRGLGKLPGQTLEEVFYEGFGPGKVAFFVEGVTDNKLRTNAEIKNIFEKSGGGLGAQGSTTYMFDKLGEIVVKSRKGDGDSEVLELIDCGAQDVEDYEDNEAKMYSISTLPTDLNLVSKNITQLGYEVNSAEIVMKPNITVAIEDVETAKKAIAFTEKLEDHDDIQKVYNNMDIPEDILNQIS
jgi:YebC/PmpR family DNA-binding regulatory protein